MIGFENMKLYTDRLVELDTTGKYVIKSNGTVPCGMMRESGETYTQRVPLQSFWGLTCPQCLGIMAEGDSMVDVGIMDGDELIVDPNKMVQSGSTVVACYQNELTVKTYSYDPEIRKVVLQPENEAKNYPPIIIDHPEELEICGVVSYISRKLTRVTSSKVKQRLKSYHEQNRLNDIISRTIDAGYMDKDGDWLKSATNELKALWIDRVGDVMGISNKWEWASERWGIPNLRRYLSRLLETNRFDEFNSLVEAIVA